MSDFICPKHDVVEPICSECFDAGMALAPDLLEAAKSAVRILCHNCPEDASPAIALLIVAITKAEGK